MKDEIFSLTIGGLLHDIGKVVQRAESKKVKHSKLGADWLEDNNIADNESILDQIRYHHFEEIKNASNIHPLSYITYFADNIASGADRRDAPDEDGGSGFDSKLPLQSVFTLINGKSEPQYYPPQSKKEGVGYPQNKKSDFTAERYKKILNEVKSGLDKIKITKNDVNSLLEILEDTLAYVPSSTNKNEVPDISLFDHSKLTAAFSCCLYEYLGADADFQSLLYKNSRKFHHEDFAQLFSVDVSGIQDFIYTIDSKGALKNLRARSFYLEIFVENLIDEILERLGLSRAQLLYSGGGHIYLILPNTKQVCTIFDEVIKSANRWLLQHFSEKLYIASGYAPCSFNLFKENPSDAFKKAGAMVSEKKLKRYGYDEIMHLNSVHKSGKECHICKKITNSNHDDDENKCRMCFELTRFTHDEFYIITEDNTGIPIFGKYLISTNEDGLKDALSKKKVIRFYAKNNTYINEKFATKILVSDYATETELSVYAKNAMGIDRLSVLRLDVDNLGTAFVQGFKEVSETEGKIYNTISRVATLSRMLSIFFKQHINEILNEGYYNITVVYSGGDDVFLVGSWNHVHGFARELNEKFSRYTQEKLTISAGVGIYSGTYPIHLMAHETETLEKSAKANDKNSITLFTPKLTFKWHEFDTVLRMKMEVSGFVKNDDIGKSFLYRILELLDFEEKKETQQINIARLAYTLAKYEEDVKPKKENKFSRLIYEYANCPLKRKQLIAAIYLHVYTIRKTREVSS